VLHELLTAYRWIGVIDNGNLGFRHAAPRSLGTLTLVLSLIRRGCSLTAASLLPRAELAGLSTLPTSSL